MSDSVEQYVRAHARPATPKKQKQRQQKQEDIPPSAESRAIQKKLAPYGGHMLLFDTETTSDAGQRLRFGFYEVHGISEEDRIKAHREEEAGAPLPLDHALTDIVQEAGFFYNPDELTADEIALLQEYVATHTLAQHADEEGVHVTQGERTLKLLTVQQFVNRLYRLMHESELLIVGHNLPFDISRLAQSWGAADDAYRGGFSLKLCSCPHKQCFRHPAIRLKHLGFAKAMMEVQRTAWRGKAPSKWQHQVHFLDTVTLGKALLGKPYSLAKLGAVLQVPEARRKLDIEEGSHGQLLTEAYLDYGRRDVIATFAIYQELRALYRKHGVSTPMWSIYSEASLGKAYLKEMGVPPFLEAHPDFPEEILGYAMNSYIGGRSEVHIRLQPVEVRYLDFKSQYPTGNALMCLQDLLLANEVHMRDVTADIRAMLSHISLADLQQPAFWQKLRVLVKIKPQGDILPVRSRYGEAQEKNIAVAWIDEGLPCWYALADVLASTLLTCKAPEIVEALEMAPCGGQRETTPITLFGGDNYSIDLTRDDFFTKVIDLRTEIKQQMEVAEKAGKSEEAAYLDGLQLALKLLASSTSYGVLVEIKQEEAKSELEPATFYDCDGQPQHTTVDRQEEPGRYFAGPIGALIPAAGRLLLTIAEKLARERGIDYAMCDTDSMAFARPAGMGRADFLAWVQEISDWFTPLSPYAGKPPIFELEKVNTWDKQDEPLYMLGISAKRYVLYNKLPDGSFRIRKFSSHGLGAISKPYADKSSPARTPEPHTNVRELGGPRWVYDLWYGFIEAWEYGSYPDGTPLPRDNKEGKPFYQPAVPYLATLAFHRVTLSTTHLYKQFKQIEGIRPFSFFTVLPPISKLDAFLRAARCNTDSDESLTETEANMKRALYEEVAGKTAFYAPYARTPGELQHIRRCDTHDEVHIEHTTVLESVRDYFQHPEWKAANPKAQGVLERRHLAITGLRYIGKESNDILRSTADETEGVLYGADAALAGAVLYNPAVPGQTRIQQVRICAKLLQGVYIADAMLVTGLSRGTIKTLQSGALQPSSATEAKVRAALPMLERIAGWRDIPIERLTAILDMEGERVQALRTGKLVLSEAERTRVLERLAAIPYQERSEQAETARCRKEESRLRHAVAQFLQHEGYICRAEHTRIPELAEYWPLCTDVCRKDGILSLDEAARMVVSRFPEAGVQTGSELIRYVSHAGYDPDQNSGASERM